MVRSIFFMVFSLWDKWLLSSDPCSTHSPWCPSWWLPEAEALWKNTCCVPGVVLAAMRQTTSGAREPSSSPGKDLKLGEVWGLFKVTCQCLVELAPFRHLA